jgi:hypothetical protein
MAATLSVFVLAGVLSAFLFIGRTGLNASSYSEMEAEARRGLEVFAEDVRMASDVRWNSAQSLTLIRPAGTGSAETTYAYDTDAGSPTYRCFFRIEGDEASGSARRVLMHDIDPDFSFKRYKLDQSGTVDALAGNDLETKQIQLTLRAVRASQGPAASNTVISARYILRNKRVSQ